jgi:hypothetical protein
MKSDNFHPWAGKDDSSVSLKSRIREAQGEATTGAKPDTRNHAGDKGVFAIISSKKNVEDENQEAVPTVEEIRTTLLRKSTNGKNSQ